MQFTTSFVLLATIVGCVFSIDLQSQKFASVEVIAVDDIKNFQAKFPEAILIPLEAKQEGKQSTIRYTLGNRVNGDRLVAQAADRDTWAAAQDVRLTLQYPISGTGAIISYVNVVVNQSSSQGQAYVVAGGIGQRAIICIVEAYNTYYFEYSAQVYGI